MSSSAKETRDSEFPDLDDVMAAGSQVPEVVRAGQINPLDTHFGYSAGERELQTRAADTGHASIVPGLLIPLRRFRKSIPNDTMAALADEDAPKHIMTEVTPRDAADALMSRYQHRGFRILMPLIGMNGQQEEVRAAGLFRTVHPPMGCRIRPKGSAEFNRLSAFDQKIVARHCVTCRLEDLRSDASLDRIEKAKPNRKQTISYGLNDDGHSVRYISEEEGLIIIHEMIKSGLEEHHEHMIDTLQQSKADVEAGRTGPGKKKYDKRDNWYFLMTHKSANDIEAQESVARAQGTSMANEMGRIVSEAIAQSGGAKGKGSTPMVSMEAVQKLLDEQEARFMKELNKGKQGQA